MTEENQEIQEAGQTPENEEQPVLNVGHILAAERERQERSVADVARGLRLHVKQVEALEANDFSALPGKTFVRGFIRNYARLLEMDEEHLLAAFQQNLPEEVHAVSVPPRGGEFSPYPSKRWMWYAAAVGLMVLGAPLLVYLLLSGTDNQTSPAKPVATKQAPAPAQAADVQPVPAATVAPESMAAVPVPPTSAVVENQPPALLSTPAAAEVSVAPVKQPEVKPAVAPGAVPEGMMRMVFKFGEESWVDVRDKDRNRLLVQLNPAGTEQVVDGVPPFRMVIGNATHVKLTLNGAPVDLAPYIDVDVARLTLK